MKLGIGHQVVGRRQVWLKAAVSLNPVDVITTIAWLDAMTATCNGMLNELVVTTLKVKMLYTFSFLWIAPVSSTDGLAVAEGQRSSNKAITVPCKN